MFNLILPWPISRLAVSTGFYSVLFLVKFDLETPTPPVSSFTLVAKSSVFELMVTKSPMLRARASFESRMSAIITLVAPVMLIVIDVVVLFSLSLFLLVLLF